MKNSESKPAGKPKKTAVTIKAAKTKKTPAAQTARTKETAVTRPMPGDDEISKKAYEIYTERMLRGEHGNAHDDWTKAIDMLLNT